MILTAENYFSPEANMEYMSVSQFKDFAGSYGRLGCESCAMAKIRGEYEEEPSTAMLVGSYVDAYFEGPASLADFQARNPDIFTRSGELKSSFKQAEKIIGRIERDPLFMQTLSGEKQVIMTGELFGLPWKIKIDSYLPDTAIVDLKVMASITDYKYVKDIGYLDFVRYWGYDIQGAVYQEIVYQNTGKRLPFYIAAATKEKVTNIEVIHVQQHYLQEAMMIVRSGIDRIRAVKHEGEEPASCGVCGYCLEHKVLKQPIGIADLLPAV